MDFKLQDLKKPMQRENADPFPSIIRNFKRATAKHQSQCEHLLSQGLSSHLGHHHRLSHIGGLLEPVVVCLLYILSLLM